MILHDVSLYGTTERKHIRLQQGFIRTIASSRDAFDNCTDEVRLELDGATVLPGFINSHDHLDFNVFPPLGGSIYNNYTEWGAAIHSTHADLIKAVQKIPNALRVQWGLYKNLINGFTTVVNHGEKLAVDNELVNVFQEYYPLHSPGFEKNWRLKLNHPFRNGKPFVMHAGEGTDAAAHAEISRVIRNNFFKRKIVAVHGVAMDAKQAASFEGLVWCPVSNYFLLGKTAAIDQLADQTTIVFGTDSTLTASWHAYEHFKAALNSGMVTEGALITMLTTAAARLWQLAGSGSIMEGMKADLLIKKGPAVFNEQPFDLVIVNGEVRVVSEKYHRQLHEVSESRFDPISINNTNLFVKKGLLKLLQEIRSFYPGAAIPFHTA